MNYFPVLRAKQNELIALRELAGLIAEEHVIPVIEPVKATPTLFLSLNRFVEVDMRFCLIVNPRLPKGNQLSQEYIFSDLLSDTLDEYNEFFPTFYVDGQTTREQIVAFSTRYADLGLGHVYFITSDPSTSALNALVEDSPSYVLLRNVSAATRNAFDLDTRALIEDPFVQRNNADYPESEFFSDRHLGTATDYAHFGDYSIVGDFYKETGGQPFAVTIHYMLARQPDTGQLDLRHFISDQTQTRGNAPEKFMEAVEKLVGELPGFIDFNRTSASTEFEAIQEAQQYSGLGILKKLGIKQHIELVAKLI